jgi:hypothetical protein
MKRLITPLAVAGTFTLIGCASPRALTLAQPVGPGNSGTGRMGALQVFTATETHLDGDNTYYYPHSSYLVYNRQGQKVKFVPNHVGTMDEESTVVLLPPGSYVVLADAEGYGRVRIPVVLKPNRTTVLHLERGWKPPANAKPSELARMPDGQAIGWRSDIPGTN